MSRGADLTYQDILDAKQKLYERAYEPCKHVVAPTELRAGAWAVCANCFSPFIVKTEQGA